MRLVDQIRFGPFSTSYHRALVTEDFRSHLESFLQATLPPQLDSPLRELDGTLIAAYDSDSTCGPNSLVRDIFTLECILLCDDGASDLKADIIYDAVAGTFKPRSGSNQFFYVWTPARKAQRESELIEIQRIVDDLQSGSMSCPPCPICGGSMSLNNNWDIFDVRCKTHGCFVYSFHKDASGRLLHGHFFTTHPLKRIRPRK